MKPSTRTWWCAVAVALAAFVPLAAASVPDPALVITASNASGTAVPLAIPFSAFEYYSGGWKYENLAAQNLYTPMPGHAYVAQVKSVWVTLWDDPSLGFVGIQMQYQLCAGSSVTSFTIEPGVVSFPALWAGATAASMDDTFILTDKNYDGDTYLSSLNNYAYKTFYGVTGNPTETFFHGSDSIGTMGGTSVGGVYSVSNNYPLNAGDFEPLGVSVDRIHAEAAFSVTPYDLAQVQHTFAVIPEPAAFGLVSIAGLLLRRRRQ
jgi:hypothetical protein